MAKAKPLFACEKCGATYPKWQGQCHACGAWDTIEEKTLAATPGFAPASINKGKAAEIIALDAPIKQSKRYDTRMGEFNRVLGGGVVPGSAILIGGDPGIGKSTILLQACAHLAKQAPVLYISGEESPEQIQLRAQRLDVADANVALVATGSLETILATIRAQNPAIVVIDSIQTVYAEGADSAPGTISQIRLCTHELMRHAKATGTAVIFVGHVTKDGSIAGPRLLEHMVDTVLYFEGERGQSFRILRAFKNRFGSTGEIGVFDMGEKGLQEVTNPSELFLSERPEHATGSAVMAAMNGTRPVLLEVQALVSSTVLAQPRRTALGFEQNRLSMISAVLDKHAGFSFANHDVFLNVTGGFKIAEPAADLAIAAVLTSSLMNKPVPEQTLVFGEVGLAGEVRSVAHMEARLKEAGKLGYKTVIGPRLGAKVKATGVDYRPIKTINELSSVLFG